MQVRAGMRVIIPNTKDEGDDIPNVNSNPNIKSRNQEATAANKQHSNSTN